MAWSLTATNNSVRAGNHVCFFIEHFINGIPNEWFGAACDYFHYVICLADSQGAVNRSAYFPTSRTCMMVCLSIIAVNNNAIASNQWPGCRQAWLSTHNANKLYRGAFQ